MQFPKLGDIVTDVRIGLSLVTILPLGPSTQISEGDIARAGWTFPVAGLLVALLGAAIYAIATKLGLSSALAALLAIAGTIIVTGALHEDGLADSADSLGGRTRDRKLEIMRDSRIGSFGVCALVISLGLRWSALAAIAAPRSVLIALVLAHSRARRPAAVHGVGAAGADRWPLGRRGSARGAEHRDCARPWRQSSLPSASGRPRRFWRWHCSPSSALQSRGSQSGRSADRPAMSSAPMSSLRRSPYC